MIYRILIYTLILGTLFGCQKGPEDPAFSLSTRKARLTGEWKVNNFSATRTGLIQEYDGESIEYTVNDILTFSRSLTWSFDFAKDGSYVTIRSEQVESDSLNNAQAYTSEQIEKGVWEFSGGNDSPSKSKLVLLVEELKTTRSDQNSNVSVTTFENPRRATVYDIVGLSNEKLKIRFDEIQSYAGGSSSTLESYTMKKL
tara:strand:+ start:1239 stop:1835 length:597 start_codon:yes stop_codon:yes gene_type:complete